MAAGDIKKEEEEEEEEDRTWKRESDNDVEVPTKRKRFGKNPDVDTRCVYSGHFLLRVCATFFSFAASYPMSRETRRRTN